MSSLEGFEMRYMDIKDKQKVRIHETIGKPAGVQFEIQNTNFDEIYEFTNLDDAFEVLPKKVRIQHRSVQKMKKYHGYTIYTAGKKLLTKTWKRNTRYYIPSSEYDFHGELSTFGDKVALISFRPTYLAIIIRDATIAQVIKNLLKLAMKGAVKNPENR